MVNSQMNVEPLEVTVLNFWMPARKITRSLLSRGRIEVCSAEQGPTNLEDPTPHITGSSGGHFPALMSVARPVEWHH